jgi:hypothetical protein
VRASLFKEANLEKIYVPYTKVLKPNAFMDVLRRRVRMKKDKVADYQLLKIEKGEKSVQEIYSQILGAIRTTDIVGMRNDGNIYIMLPQADEATIKKLIGRITEIKVRCELVDFLTPEKNKPAGKLWI